MKIKLVLENGSEYHGESFGYNKSVSGEVVFSTNMTGYPESLTDPSFCKQLLCLTYPIVGNYGVPNCEQQDEYGILKHLESNTIWVSALIVNNYTHEYSHYQAEKSLSDWLIEKEVVGISNIDTRRLTLELRNTGTMLGKIIVQDDIEFNDIHKESLVKYVSTREPYTLGDGKIHIGVVDCGVKYNILRNLLQEGFKITVLPHDYDYNDRYFDGIFISNGPGDPRKCVDTIKILRKYINSKDAKPVFGICMGNQLLALASGAEIYKMKYGNRGYNQPVYIEKYNKTYITSQNHGYAVDTKSLGSDWCEFCKNKNDDSNEGIYHKTKPFRSVQFHPEARGGPCDTMFMFKEFYDECCDMKYGVVNKNKVLLLGSGGLSIGQAGEFDYSGSQAIKSFKEKGYTVVLVNPNIATIQTSEGFADKVYYIPVEKDFVSEIICKERPQYISLSFGGQTALNCGIDLHKSGILSRYNVEVLGTSVDNILKTEDRDLFAKAMTVIGESTPISFPATNIEEALEVAHTVNYPVLVRAAFALGGLGSGFCNNDDELVALLEKTFTKTNQVLIDQDLRGWKEVEYEVMRDVDGNSIVICNMENFDPLGIHTGDSIVVAPSQTLTNDEYNMLRTASLKIAASLGIVGECNVQIALDPHSSTYKIIEVNPRLSRSSALASKATGYPIAAVAAQLCLKEKLYDITNVVTGNTTANFEPSLDYIVVKIPRWDTLKFRGVDRHLGSAMKSVGEIMSIGKSFEEAFQKGLRMINGKGFETYGDTLSLQDIKQELKYPTDDRVRVLAHALMGNEEVRISVSDIHELTKIDNWFLMKLFNIACLSNQLNLNRAGNLTIDELRCAKNNGFSDIQIANLVKSTPKIISQFREKANIVSYRKQIDTLAGEYASQTNYMYTTYHADSDDEIVIKNNKKKVIVLGSGKYRIGSSVEFDYCSVKCAEYLREAGYNTIMINYNPETMSTDFDNSDLLYFEELSFESICDIYKREDAYGIVISMGGQEPNNLAVSLNYAGLNILGTNVDSIDTCEDRSRYSNLLDSLNITQPDWICASSKQQIDIFVEKVGFPILVRPSYVLSGAAMQIVSNLEKLQDCLKLANSVSPDHPIVLTKFIENAVEVDVDAVANSGDLICYAMSEHIENAGVHSGDASLVLPSYSLTESQKETMLYVIRELGKALNISGPYNTQFLVRGDWIGVIETNLRASRSLPFVSKTLDIDFIKQSVNAMLGEPYNYIGTRDVNYVGVKCPQFSFNRLPEADPVLGVEMASTGEVACYGNTLHEAYLKSLVASRSGIKLKTTQTILVLDDCIYTKAAILQRGHHIVDKLDHIVWGNIDMVVNCNQESSSKQVKEIRRLAVDFSKYLITNKQQLALVMESLGTELNVYDYKYYKNSLYKKPVKLFIRQGFTESDVNAQEKLQKALDSIANYENNRLKYILTTGTKAESKDSFKENFSKRHNIEFTPNNFREHRLKTLGDSDAMIIFRTGLSESTVFEVAFNIFREKRIPIFYAIEPGCEIKTTLLRELNGYNDIVVKYKVIEGGIENVIHDPDFKEFLDSL